MECIPVDDIKHHFKLYPKAFRGESAVSTMVDTLGFDKTEANECISGVLYAQLIVNCDKPREQELKWKHIYCLSVKGALILRDVKAKRLLFDPPNIVYSRNTNLTTNLIYVDRDMEGNLVQPEGTLTCMFKHCLGDKPNFTKFETQPLVYTEGAPEVESYAELGGLTPVWPLFLRNHVVRLKGYTHAFTGAALVDWILRCTSVVSRLEAIILASAFVDNLWITCVSAEEAGTPVAGSAATAAFPGMNVSIKDSSKVVYQPTMAGAKLAGWDLAMETPTTTSAVQGFFSRKKNDNDATGPRQSTESPARISVAEEDRGSDVIRKSTHSDKEPSKSMIQLAPDVAGGEDSDFYGWESCHTNLISMDGSKARSKTASIAPASTLATPSIGQSSSIGQLNPEAIPVITKIITSARPKAFAIKKASAHEYSQAKLPDMLPMDPNLPRDPLVMQLKEKTHNSRLVQILSTPELCEEFRKYNHFMYSQENFGFWSEADSFRRLYSIENAVIIPGQPITYKDKTIMEEGGGKEAPSLVQIVSHAMAIYLKYIVDEAPYEVNVGSIRKKNITAAVTCEELIPFFDLINPDSIITHEIIDPKRVLLPGTEGMLASRLATIEKSVTLGITASLFDVAENHIFSLMATDSVTKFLKTTAYHNTMSALIKKGGLKRFDDDEVAEPRVSAINRKMSSRESATDASSLAKFAMSAEKRASSVMKPQKDEAAES
ncbi:hypothetical protein BC830DRAFT_667889 [Chytriomyces sp. MP71]|nr:hypothetical protein BC830DRAFT_667889 [Chytriomyces sp. MP71]